MWTSTVLWSAKGLAQGEDRGSESPGGKVGASAGRRLEGEPWATGEDSDTPHGPGAGVGRRANGGSWGWLAGRPQLARAGSRRGLESRCMRGDHGLVRHDSSNDGARARLRDTIACASTPSSPRGAAARAESAQRGRPSGLDRQSQGPLGDVKIALGEGQRFAWRERESETESASIDAAGYWPVDATPTGSRDEKLAGRSCGPRLEAFGASWKFSACRAGSSSRPARLFGSRRPLAAWAKMLHVRPMA